MCVCVCVCIIYIIYIQYIISFLPSQPIVGKPLARIIVNKPIKRLVVQNENLFCVIVIISCIRVMVAHVLTHNIDAEMHVLILSAMTTAGQNGKTALRRQDRRCSRASCTHQLYRILRKYH